MWSSVIYLDYHTIAFLFWRMLCFFMSEFFSLCICYFSPHSLISFLVTSISKMLDRTEPTCDCFLHSVYLYQVAQMVKGLPTMWEPGVQSLGREDLLEKEMATHSSILAWKIPWTEEPGRLQSMGSERVRHDWVTSLSLWLYPALSSSPAINAFYFGVVMLITYNVILNF